MRGFDTMKATIGIFGSHSAEEIGVAAKSHGFRTVVVCEKGREKLYTVYNRHLFDEYLILDRFRDLLLDENQTFLEELDTIFIPNRSFVVYCGYEQIERKFRVPLYGNRYVLKIEERKIDKNQYWLMEQANIRYPRLFKPNEIDRLVVAKTQQKDRPLERAFFYATSPEEFYQKGNEMVRRGLITQEELDNCVIEEFIVGPRFNANFHAYGLEDIFGRLDFAGFDDRIQTNLSGILNLPARDQLKLQIPVTNEEVGHKGVTMRESKKPLVYEAAEKFLDAVEEHFPPKMIGSFSLQGAITPESEFVIFDISPRVPGSPCIGPTSPEMRRLSLKHRVKIESLLDLSMIEIEKALELNRLSEITT